MKAERREQPRNQRIWKPTALWSMPENEGEMEMVREMVAGSLLPGSQQSRWHYRSLSVKMSFSWVQVLQMEQGRNVEVDKAWRGDGGRARVLLRRQTHQKSSERKESDSDWKTQQPIRPPAKQTILSFQQEVALDWMKRRGRCSDFANYLQADSTNSVLDSHLQTKLLS